MTEFMGYVSSYFVTFLQVSGFILSAILFGLLIAYGFRGVYRWIRSFFVQDYPLPISQSNWRNRMLRFRRQKAKITS